MKHGGKRQILARYPIAAWKTYTQWGVDGKGFFLSDDVGTRFIEKARALATRISVSAARPVYDAPSVSMRYSASMRMIPSGVPGTRFGLPR